jgi:hypothetical protein
MNYKVKRIKNSPSPVPRYYFPREKYANCEYNVLCVLDNIGA